MRPFILLLCLFLIAGAVPAQAPEIVEAEPMPAPGAAPAPDDMLTVDQLNLTYTGWAAENEPSVTEEISTNLIDLDPLRQMLEAQAGYERVRVSLEEAIALALEQNLEIEIAEYDPAIAAAEVFAARGEFDPVATASGQYVRASESLSQQNIAFGGISSIETYNTTLTGGVQGKLHYGTRYAINFDLQKEETTFGDFIEEFDTNMSFTLTQPLLRGFGKDINLVRVRQARNRARMTEAQLRLTVLTTVADVIRAYWELVGAMQNLQVQEESLENAERLLDITSTRNELGVAADLEVVQSKAGVASRQSDLIAARARVADASDLLKQLLFMHTPRGVFSEAQVVPTTRPNELDMTVFDPLAFEKSLEESIALALEYRPEMTLAELEIENARLEMVRTRNEMLPQFDLTGSIGRGGRDHQLRESLQGIADKQDDYYSYGFEASIPLGNRGARGAHHSARLAKRQAELREAQTEQQLVVNIRLAARNVMTNRMLLESARQTRRLQEANVVAEEKRLQLGATSSWQVLQIQEDLTVAQLQEVQALIAYETALTDLQFARGTLLRHLGVSIEDADFPTPVGYLPSLVPRWD